MRQWDVSESREAVLSWFLLALCGLLWHTGHRPFASAEDAIPPAADSGPASIGQFLTLSDTVDDAVASRVNRAALGLQARAQREKRKGILVLEISPGSSPFHQVQGLARFLANDLPALTTVAWVPAPVTGNHVVLALACSEIIMHPDASLGDISLGTPLDADQRNFVVNLANRRHNRQISEALVLGMLDRQSKVQWVQVETGEPPNAARETRVVTESGLADLARTRVQILDVKTIKEVGSPGVFSGERARAYNILAMHTARSRDELATLYGLPREALRENPTAGDAPRAMLIRVDEMIDPMLSQFVQRQIERAAAAGVNLLIFEIDSPGGYLRESLDIAYAIADLETRKIRTVAWVPKMAYSGAAVIALGCDEIYLRPEAQIGDAGPIEMQKDGRFEFAPQKILGPLRSNLKTLADRKHRPAALAEAMADKDLNVYQVTHRDNGQVWFMTDDEIHNSNGQWNKGRLVPDAGSDRLLTVNGRRAHELQLAETPVRDFEELKWRLGVPNDVEVAVSARTWIDSLIYGLNTTLATTLIFFAGIMFIYFELHFPSGLFGILSCVCFGVFFWSRFLGGTAGWLEVVLFLLGTGCLAIEIFVLPGFGVFGVSGVLLCLASLVLASQTFVIPASESDLGALAKSLGSLSGAIVGTVVLAALVSRYLPAIPWFNEMILTPPGAADSRGGPRLRPELSASTPVNPVLERDQALVGRQGTTTTVLRPAGKAQIGDQFVDVVSDGPFISAGRPVEIISVEGTRVVVREMA
ncbi:MAG: NfeD family protein [Planctomycetaceae bacterium]